MTNEGASSPLRLDLKVVFYGPALSGKTTNLMHLHQCLCSQRKGELMVMETRDDRTLFFDLLPVGLRQKDLDIRLKLYTVPGQVQHDSTRKAVLARADGVIFVADSDPRQQDNNAAALDNLADNLSKVGLSIEQIPLVVQFNKRDLAQAVSAEQLQQTWQNTPWAPLSMASALRGEGVIETFASLLQRLYPGLDLEHDLAATHEFTAQRFVQLLCHAQEIR